MQKIESHDGPASKSELTREVFDEIRRSSVPTIEFYLMNLFAAAVASYGLLSNSVAVVIGAMVIAVLLGPISGFGLALVSRDRLLMGRSAFTLITGAMEVFIVAFLIGWIHSGVPLTHEILSRTQPNLFDLMIALAGGAAGAYAVGRRVPGGTLIGVAIATALVPPIASSAIAAAHGEGYLARQALLLFFTNAVAIQCAYSVVLHILHVAPSAKGGNTLKNALKAMTPSPALLAVLAIVLGLILSKRVNDENLNLRIRSSLESALDSIPGASLGEAIVTKDDSVYNVIASVRTAVALCPEEISAIEDGMHT